MDNSLIAGMPEVIAYIKKIEEENQALKEKLSDTEYDLDSLKTDLKPLDDMMYENKINEYEDVVEHVAYLETSVQTTANYWESKYENEVDTNKMLMEAIEAQTEAEEKLKNVNEKIVEETTKHLNMAETLYEGVAKENEKLKDEWTILNKFCSVEKENDGQAIVDWICKFFDIEDKYCALEEENKKLKEENEKLQKYSEIMGDIDGDELTDLLKNHSWEYNDEGELEKVTD